MHAVLLFFKIMVEMFVEKLAGIKKISESVVALSMKGCNVLFHPLIKNSSHYFYRPKQVYATQTLTSTEHQFQV